MVFITGATGFIGGHLLIHLIQKGEKVRAIYRPQSNFEELEIICRFYQIDYQQVKEKTEWTVGDLLDIASLEKALRGIKTVYHCAAVVSFDGKDSENIDQINRVGTFNLVEQAMKQGVGCFGFVSSIGALGQSEEGKPIDENTPWKPENNSSVYSRSKYAAEQIVWDASKSGLDVVIVNPGVVLGVGDARKSSLRFFSQVEKGMPFYTSQQTGYVDVRDVCRALLELTDREFYNQRFVLVSENLTNKQLFSLIATSMNKRPPFIHVTSKFLGAASKVERSLSFILKRTPLLTPEIVRSAVKKESYSSEKVRKALHFHFIPMKQSIEETIKFLYPSVE